MKKLICFLLGHKYRVTRKITPTIKELQCSRCKERFAINHTVKTLLPLDDELIELHNSFLK